MILLKRSVPDKQGVSGQTPDKVSNMTRQINRKFMMIWWEHWKLTRWNQFLIGIIP